MSDQVRAIILDIEGTTTPVEFVFNVLFPYASEQAGRFLAENWTDRAVQEDVAGLRDEHAADVAKGLDPPAWISDDRGREVASVGAYVRWLISHDRKITVLKSLQGKIWRAGYEAGQLHAEVYNDVPPALDRWTRQGKTVGIFSSGSVLAQRLLFSHTNAGDLTALLTDYFDTTVGSKVEPESYRRITAAFGIPPSDVLFISDVVAELDAARAAGMNTALCVRPGRTIEHGGHAAVATFDSIYP